MTQGYRTARGVGALLTSGSARLPLSFRIAPAGGTSISEPKRTSDLPSLDMATPFFPLSYSDMPADVAVACPTCRDPARFEPPFLLHDTGLALKVADVGIAPSGRNVASHVM